MDERLVINLAIARRHQAEIKERMKGLIATVTETPGYKALELELNDGCQDEADALTELQDAAMQEYATTGNKQPHKAVTIKVYTTATITDPQGALQWCFNHYTPGLLLDEKAFADLIKQGKAPAEFGQIDAQPKANVSRDLSEFVPKTEPEDNDFLIPF